MSELAHQLAHPARCLSLEELAASWSEVRIVARVEGYGHLAHDTVLLRRVRGGLGRVLMGSASEAALAGRPCPWSPPCALDVLFREQGRNGAHGIPKPFVLAGLRRGNDLEIVLTLFGAAGDWASVVMHALVATLRDGIDWRGQRRDVFGPVAVVSGVQVTGREGVQPGLAGDRFDLDFLTPLTAESDEPLERPATVLARLARRVEGMARWQDVAIEADWRTLAVAWEGMSYDVSGLRRARVARRSGRGSRTFAMEAIVGTLGVDGLTQELCALLAIGQQVHIGKGASEGFGRFVLTAG